MAARLQTPASLRRRHASCCAVLCCVVMCCAVLCCAVLPLCCAAVSCCELRCDMVCCAVVPLSCAAVSRCTVLHCTALHCTALYCAALCCRTASSCSTRQRAWSSPTPSLTWAGCPPGRQDGPSSIRRWVLAALLGAGGDAAGRVFLRAHACVCVCVCGWWWGGHRVRRWRQVPNLVRAGLVWAGQHDGASP